MLLEGKHAVMPDLWICRPDLVIPYSLSPRVLQQFAQSGSCEHFCIYQPGHSCEERAGSVKCIGFSRKLWLNATRRGVTVSPGSEESVLRLHATVMAAALANMRMKMLSSDEVHRIS